MKLFTVATALSLIATAAVAGPGKPLCKPEAEMVRSLTEQNGAPVAAGRTQEGGVMALWSSAGGEKWAAVLTLPSGISCLVATGTTLRTRPYQCGNPRSCI